MGKIISMLGIAIVVIYQGYQIDYSSEPIYGEWRVSKIMLRRISTFSTAETKKFRKQSIWISNKSIDFWKLPLHEKVISINKDSVLLDLELVEILKLENPKQIVYTLNCESGIEESVVLLKNQELIFESDGAIFFCKKKRSLSGNVINNHF